MSRPQIKRYSMALCRDRNEYSRLRILLIVNNSRTSLIWRCPRSSRVSSTRIESRCRYAHRRERRADISITINQQLLLNFRQSTLLSRENYYAINEGSYLATCRPTVASSASVPHNIIICEIVLMFSFPRRLCNVEIRYSMRMLSS